MGILAFIDGKRHWFALPFYRDESLVRSRIMKEMKPRTLDLFVIEDIESDYAKQIMAQYGYHQ